MSRYQVDATARIRNRPETKLFADRIRASAAMLVNGRALRVIAPGGHVFAVIDITTHAGRVARIEITRASLHSEFVPAIDDALGAWGDRDVDGQT